LTRRFKPSALASYFGLNDADTNGIDAGRQEVEAYRLASRSALVLSTGVLLDADSHRRTRCLLSIAKFFKHESLRNQKNIRTSEAHGQYVETVLTGEVLTWVASTLEIFGDRTELQAMQFRFAEYMHCGTNLEMSELVEEATYAKFTWSFTVTYCGLRLPRLMDQGCAWPHRGDGLLSESLELRDGTAAQLEADHAVWERVEANTTGKVWHEIKARSPFRTVPMIQLVKTLQLKDWKVAPNADAKEMFARRRNRPVSSHACEHAVKVLRRLEQTGTNNVVSLQACSSFSSTTFLMT
jgi:hypothetical protein